MAKLIKSNGEITEVKPKKGKFFSLEELQGYVGGYIEFVGLNGDIMVVNEEGKLNDLPYNEKATKFFQFVHGDIDVIVGDVLIASQKEIN